MDYSKLDRANKISDELKGLSSVLRHFENFEGKATPKDYPEFVTNFINECRNLGNSGIKRELIINDRSFVVDSIGYLKTKISMLEKEFSEL